MTLLQDITNGAPVEYLRAMYPDFDRDYYGEHPKQEAEQQSIFVKYHICKLCQGVFPFRAQYRRYCPECANAVFLHKQDRKDDTWKQYYYRKRAQNA